MENTIYETMRNAGKKCLLPVASTLAYFGFMVNTYTAELPVYQPVKDAIVETQKSRLEKGVEKAINKFNVALKDETLTLEEQKEVYNCLDSAGINEKFAQVSPEVRNLYDLIDKNLHGWDVGTTELEQRLLQQGLNIKVKGENIEFAYSTLMIMGALGIVALACKISEKL